MPKRTFYVSTSGSDTNDGLSEITPWKTLSHVSEQTYGPGDSVLLKCGNLWEEPLTISAQGHPQHPMVFSSYGPGDKPIVRCATGDVVKAVNPRHLIIQGLHIQCTTHLPLFPEPDYRNHNRHLSPFPLNRGLFLEFDGTVSYDGIVIADNTVAGPGVDSFTEGINALVHYTCQPGDDPESIVTDLQFIGNEVHGFGWVGLTTSGESTGEENQRWFPQFLFSDVKMLHNTVYDIGVQGLLLCHGKDSVMKWNTVHHAGMYKGPGVAWSPAGLWVWSSRNVDLMYNEVFGMEDSDSAHDATGFDIDWHSEEIRIRYNYAHDNLGNGIVTMACRNSSISENRVESNRCKLNCGKGQIGLTNWHQDAGEDRINNVENLEMADNLIIIAREDTGALNALKTAEGPEWQGNSFAGNRIVLKSGITPAFLYNIQPDAAVDRIGNNVFYGFPEGFRNAGAETDTFAPIESHPPLSVQHLSATRDEDSRWITLSWDIDEALLRFVHHVNIHRSRTLVFTPGYTNLVGQTNGFIFTDSIPVGTESVTYIVRVEDIYGEYGPMSEIHVKV